MIYALLTKVDLANPNINPTAKFGDFASILNLVMPVVMAGAALTFFGIMLYGAYTIITASGNPENITKAQKIFKFAIIGLVIVLAAFLIIKLIEFGINTNIPGI